MHISHGLNALLGRPALAGKRARRATRWSGVEPLEQRIAPANFIVTSVSDNTGAGTLRRALLDAAGTTGIDNIDFNIPGGGVHTIRLSSPLPIIFEGVIINGYSQPNSKLSTRTADAGTDALLLIEIDGTDLGSGGTGFDIFGSNTKITGLAINHFGFAGVSISSGGSNNAVEGNFIGTNAAGTAAAPNGIGITLGNGFNSSIKGNLLSGNSGAGIFSSKNSGTQIQGNIIGSAADGVTPLSNNGPGISIDSSTGEVIGGPAAGLGNLIAFNQGDGIRVLQSGAATNMVRGNFIHNNAGLGINLTGPSDPTPVTPNDLGDGDNGANNLQNFPVLTTAEPSATGISVAGTLNSTPNSTFALDFFSSAAANPSGFGEGQVYLGTLNVTTNSAGNASFVFNGTKPPLGSIITATATNTTLAVTSEFSQTLVAVNPTVVTTALDVVNGADGLTSLREALLFANGTPGLDTINFAIPATGVQTLAPTSALPVITDAVVIDGYSQPGTAVNIGTAGVNSKLLIELSGVNAGNVDGLRITAGGSTVQGLAINRWGGFDISLETNGGNVVAGNYLGTSVNGGAALASHGGVHILNSPNNTIGGTSPAQRNLISGIQAFASPGVAYGNIHVEGSSSTANLIQGNLIGTNATGTAPLSPLGVGIYVEDAQNTTIGGTTAAARNVISGNVLGIQIFGSNARLNVVQGNFIGPDVTGTVALGNDVSGISLLDGAGNNTIGGTVAGARNIISGAQDTIGSGFGYGISLNSSATTAGASNNVIQGNYVGTDFTGTVALGNLRHGIFIGGSTSGAGSSGNTIGGIAAGAGNLVAYNGADGVYVARGTGNAIRGNAIFSNGGLGIDLGTDGVTANDLGDADTGPNNLQNYPVLTTATRTGTFGNVSGTLNSTPLASVLIDFYASPAADASGFGEGRIFLGNIGVTTDASGNATFNFSPSSLPAPGSYITATSVDAAGNTSEFSQALALGTTFVWDAGAGSDQSWFNPLNWDADSGVPGVGDTAILGINATIALATSTSVGTFNQTNGTLSGAGTLSVLSSFAWGGGTQGPGGKTALGAGALSQIGGSGTKLLNARTLENAGTLTWTGSGALQAVNNPTFDNLASATLDLQADSGIQYGGSGTNLTLTNAGLVTKTAGSGTFTFAPGVFANTGTVRAASGSIRFTGAVTAGGTFEATTGALAFAGATTLTTNVTFNSIDLAGGTLSGTGTVAGSWTWSGGTLGTNGALTIPAAGTLTLTGAADKLLDSYTVNNNGTVALTGTGRLLSLNAAVLNNSSTGLFDLKSNTAVTWGGSGTDLAFNNSGTLQKSAGAGISSFAPGTLNNLGSGLVLGAAGVLNLPGAVATAGTLRATTGTLTLNGATTVSGTPTFDNIDFNAGTVTGSATVTGNWRWSGGSITGASLSIPTGSTLTLSGSGSKTLDASTLANSGTVAHLGSGSLLSVNTAIFNNLASGVYDLQGDRTLTYGGSGANLAFNNAGLVKKSAGAATATLSTGNFVNTGTVRADSGTINFPGAVSAGGIFQASAGQALTFNGATTLTSSVTFNSIDLAGGTLSGTGTVAGSWTWSGGTLGAGGTLTIPTTGTLTLTGAADKRLDNYSVTNNGTVVFTGAGRLLSSNAATFTNSGTGLFDLKNDAAVTWGGSGIDLVFNNSGTLQKSAGTGTTSFAPGNLKNLAGGLVLGSSGVLNLPRAVAAAGTLRATTGTLTLTGTTTVSGTPTFDNLDFNAGILTGSATVAGDWRWSGGSITGASLSIPTGSTLTLSGSGNKLLDASTVANSGTVAHLGSGSLLSVNTAIFNNLASGVYDLQGDRTLTWGGSGVNLAFNNAGLVKKSAGAATATLSTGNFVNTGTVRADSGTINFPGAVSAGGIFQASAGQALTFNGATTLTSNVTFNSIDLAGGTLSGTGTVAGSWTWSGGTLGAGGTLTISTTGTLTLTGSADKRLDNYSVTNNGTVVLTGAGRLLSVNAATFTNSSTGLFDLKNDAAVTWGGSGTDLVFNNSGTLQKSAGAGTTSFAPGTLNNLATGLVRAQTGTLNLPTSVSAGGTFTAAGGALTLTGAATLTSNVTFNGLQLAGGTISGTGTVAGSWTWSGGTLGAGGTLTIPTTGTLTLTGGTDKRLDNYNVTNNGTVVLTGAGRLLSSNTPTFTNTSSGLLDLQSDTSVAYGGSGPNLVFNNAGTVRKSAGSGASGIDSTFTNTGTVRAQSGTLSFTGFTQSAGTTSLEGGALGGGTLAFTGGILTGSGAIGANVNNSGATVRPGGTGAAGTIAITGAYTQSGSGTLAAEIGGATAGTQYDQLTVTGAATLGGTLQASLINGFAPTTGSFAVQTFGSRSGAFTTTNLPSGFGSNITASAVQVGPLDPKIVNTTLDVVNANDGFTSLREALTYANSNAGIDTITFNIPGSGVQTIAPTSALPTITEAVVIDGYSQPGASANTLATGSNAVLLIEINGVNAGASSGLKLTSGGSTLRGLAINGFAAAGLHLTSAAATGNVIAGNFLGTTAAGTAAAPNATGLLLDGGAHDNTLGGTTPAAGNLISGNTGDGVAIVDPAATGNIVRGNRLGLNATGTGPLGNGGAGIHLTDAHGNTLGATDGLNGNRIAGNTGDGILSETTTRNFALGEYDGSPAYQDSNSANFLALQTGEGAPFTTLYTSGQTITFTVAGAFVPGYSTFEIRLWNVNPAQAGNQVASVSFDGVAQTGLEVFEASGQGPGFIESYFFSVDPALLTDGQLTVGLKLGTLPVGQSVGLDYANVTITPYSDNTIVGNTIGSIAAGAVVNTAPNGGDGIHLVNATGAQIGDGTAGGRNVIGKNTGAGVFIDGGNGNTVQGNYLGMSAAGGAASNSSGLVVQSSGQNQIGGLLAGQGNVLSGNSAAGLQLLGGSVANVVQGNFLGVDDTGDTALPNGVGVILSAPSNRLGTSDPGGGNVISGNTGDGVQIFGSSAGGNSVLNNFIGFNATGDDTLPNGGDGLTLDGGASNNTIGGPGSGEANFISGNAGDGLSLYDSGTTGNVIEGNRIGTSLDGSAAEGNGSAGVSLNNGASANTLRGNVISGNLFDGVLISDANTAGNILTGNFIGTDLAGTAPVPNGGDGVHIQNGATDTQIGGLAIGAGNVIANNDDYGVFVGAGSIGHTILGNSLHDNGLEGIRLENSSPVSGNQNQPAPIFNGAYTNPNGIFFLGQFSAAPNTSFRVEFFTADGIDAAHNNSSEGETFLGALTATANGAGLATFSQVLPASLSLGDLVTATATALVGNSLPAQSSAFAAAATVTLPPPMLSIGGAAVTEGASGTITATFLVTLSATSTSTVTVDFATTVDPAVLLVAAAGLATAGVDFQSLAGQLSFAPGQLTKTVQVTVKGDLTPEARERFAVQLTNPTNSLIDQALGVGVIRDDDHHLFAAAAGTGSMIQVFDATDGSLLREFDAFESRYHGGVRVATGDVNGDGTNDIIAATGQGGNARVRVFDGLTGDRFTGTFAEFKPFTSAYRGGLNVAAGDVNGDGFADLIVSPSAGSSGAIRVFDGATGAMFLQVRPFAKVSGGIRVAAGDVNGDGLADIIATSGSRGEVRTFDAATGLLASTFQAYDKRYRGGLYVGAGDLDGDGLDDIIVGTSSGRSQVRGFVTGGLESAIEFSPFAGRHGVRVGVVDANSDGIADIIAAQGSRGTSKVRVFDGRDQSELFNLAAISGGFRGGIFVA